MHDAATGEQTGVLAIHQCRAQADDEFAVAPGIQPAQRRGVPATVETLEAANMLHGLATFVAADGGCRVQRRDHLQQACLRAQAAFNQRAQVLDPAQALYSGRRRYL
ncbi:hypothetical protein D3C72_1737270 [compost metagenome]